jgi:hypothetical protein
MDRIGIQDNTANEEMMIILPLNGRTIWGDIYKAFGVLFLQRLGIK